jgi:thiol-disulfide isomerase/thioredoxin
VVAIAAIATYAVIQHNRAVSGAAVTPNSVPSVPPPAVAGSMAKPFALQAPLGSFSNASLAGKPYLLELFATWCPHCQRMTAVLRDIRAKFPESKLAMISVSASPYASNATPDDPVPENQADVDAFDQHFNVTWPTFFDPKLAVAQAWGLNGFPTIFIVDARGKIAWTSSGEMKESVLLAGLRKAGIQ